MSTEDAATTKNEADLTARMAMMVAFALILSPLVMLFIFLLLRAISSGDAFGMLMIAAFVWFAFAEYSIGSRVDRLVDLTRLSFMTPKRRKALSDALVLGPVMAFCFIDQNGTMGEMMVDYGQGLLLVCAVIMLQSELVVFLKPHAARLWASLGKT